MNEFRPLGSTLFPPVVKNLMIINGILFLASYVFQQTFGFDLNEYLGLFYFESEKFKVWQLVTHLFMHGSFGHILSNMLALWMFGSVLENFLGSNRFLRYYFFTGLGAAFLHSLVQYYELHGFVEAAKNYMQHPSLGQLQHFVEQHVTGNNRVIFDEYITAWQAHPQTNLSQESAQLVNQLFTAKLNTVTVGASGAVFGLLMAFGYLFPNALIYVYFAIPIKAKYFVAIYGLFELFSGIQNTDNIAHYAHLGGMLFGFILFRIWKIKRPQQFY